MSHNDELYVNNLEDKVDGLEADLDSLLHATMKAVIRTEDKNLSDFMNLNYNPFVQKYYPFQHRPIAEVKVS